VTLLLNHVVLAAGEAMFIDAGVIHAYTSGFGLEIMAASDNVVRAGLTPKFVDIPELLHISNFTPVPPPLWAPTQLRADGRDVLLAPPADEFELRILAVAPDMPQIPASGPRIMLALDDTLTVRSADEQVALARGGAVFVSDADGPVTVSGAGRIAVGSPGR
jgi:mannose-6-phosphate isomerase